jgi:hypothetical protein
MATISYLVAGGEIRKVVLGTSVAGTPTDDNVKKVADFRLAQFKAAIWPEAGPAPEMTESFGQMNWGSDAEFYPSYLLKWYAFEVCSLCFDDF